MSIPSQYKEVEKLRELYEKHGIEIVVSKNDFLNNQKDYPAIKITLDGYSFDMYAEDEYNNFQINNPLLTLCVVLRELEDYEYASDYTEWCIHHYFDVKNVQVLAYYRSLARTYREIESLIGKIHGQISDFDFECNAGPMWELRGEKLSD